MFGNGERKNAGLCLTCGNASVCCHRLKHGYDAIFCEMFDGYSDPSCENDSIGYEEIHSKEIVLNNLKEFRINCTNRETCKLMKPDEGIWH